MDDPAELDLPIGDMNLNEGEEGEESDEGSPPSNPSFRLCDIKITQPCGFKLRGDTEFRPFSVLKKNEDDHALVIAFMLGLDIKHVFQDEDILLFKKFLITGVNLFGDPNAERGYWKSYRRHLTDDVDPSPVS